MLNLADILFIIPLAWFGWKGFRKGLIVELSTLAALILGIWIAMHFSDIMGNWLGESLHFNSEYKDLVAFALTFLVVVLVVNMLGRLVSKLAGMIMLAWLDKLAGTVFGIAKAAFIISVILYFINTLDKEESFFTPESKASSFLYAPLQKIAPAVFPYLRREKIELLIPDIEGNEVPEIST